MNKKYNKIRCSSFISEYNYEGIDEIIENETIFNMKPSKGAVIDIGISLTRICLAKGKTLNDLALEHLKFIGDDTDGI